MITCKMILLHQKPLANKQQRGSVMTNYSIRLDMHPGSERGSALNKSADCSNQSDAASLHQLSHSHLQNRLHQQWLFWEVKIIHFAKRGNWNIYKFHHVILEFVCWLRDKNRNVLRSPLRKRASFLFLDIRKKKVIKNNYKLQLCSPGAVATRYAEPFHPDDALGIPNNRRHNFCLVKQEKIKLLG